MTLPLHRLAALALLAAGFAALAPAAAQGAYHVIICGSGGDEEYRGRFAAWGGRLERVLAEKIGEPKERIHLMTEPGEGAPDSNRVTSLAAIRAVLADLAARARPEDDLFVYLIGHGSYMQRASKFHIPGPDLSAAELNSILSAVPARRVVVINASSSSAGFINELSAERRVICAATKSAEEKNATEFMEFFLKALEDGGADRNRDERVSVLEACAQAAAMTEAWYAAEGIIATEHALLDDNGDGLGTRVADLAAEPEAAAEGETAPDAASAPPDGALAASTYIKNFSFPPAAPAELVERYLAALRKIEALKDAKGSSDSAAYARDLEALLLEAARANREIRKYAPPAPAP